MYEFYLDIQKIVSFFFFFYYKILEVGSKNCTIDYYRKVTKLYEIIEGNKE